MAGRHRRRFLCRKPSNHVARPQAHDVGRQAHQIAKFTGTLPALDGSNAHAAEGGDGFEGEQRVWHERCLQGLKGLLTPWRVLTRTSPMFAFGLV
jgi:hypothetical protein